MCIFPQVTEADLSNIVDDKGSPIAQAHKMYFVEHAKLVKQVDTRTHHMFCERLREIERE